MKLRTKVAALALLALSCIGMENKASAQVRARVTIGAPPPPVYRTRVYHQYYGRPYYGYDRDRYFYHHDNGWHLGWDHDRGRDWNHGDRRRDWDRH